MSAVPVPSSPDQKSSPVPTARGQVLVLQGTDYHLIRIGRGRADNIKVKDAFYSVAETAQIVPALARFMSPEDQATLLVTLLQQVPAERRQELIDLAALPNRKRPARGKTAQPTA